MPNMPLYYNIAGTIVPEDVTFLNSSGQTTDPATIQFVLVDPEGETITHNYSSGTDPNAIVRDTTGKYHINLQLFDTDPAPSGLYNFTWVGVGGSVANGAQVTTGTFRVFSLDTAGASKNLTYVSMEELKSSDGLKESAINTKDDYEMQRAVLTATSLINDLCGQHFYRLTETRTYSYQSIYEIFIDSLVPGTITSFKLDYDGDGIYEANWTENTDYQTSRYQDSYNPRNFGEDRPHNYVRVLMGGPGGTQGGQFLPFIWPWTPNNRIEITATWGWKEIPQNVHHAALLLAVDLFKMKDAPWGVAGTSELGMVRVQSNPQIMELLKKYMNSRGLVGV
jgi:hypothetical protein